MTQEHHLSKQFDQDLEAIRSRVLLMGGLAERQFRDAMASLHDDTSELAEKVLQFEVEINQLEVSLDSVCTQLIVRRQPTANDLRTVMATTKIITDLERIGDEATKIARSVKSLQGRSGRISHHEQAIKKISKVAADMLHDALDAFARLDKMAAVNLINRDDELDRAFHTMMDDLIVYMKENPDEISTTLDLLWIAKSIERIGDHSTNLAEQVVYIIGGKDIRHTDYAAEIGSQ